MEDFTGMSGMSGMSGNSSPASSFFGDSGLGSSSDYQRPHGHGAGDWAHRSASGSFIPNLEPRLQNLEKENTFLRAENGAIKYVLP